MFYGINRFTNNNQMLHRVTMDTQLIIILPKIMSSTCFMKTEIQLNNEYRVIQLRPIE